MTLFKPTQNLVFCNQICAGKVLTEFKPEHRIQFHCDQILSSIMLCLGGPQICLLSAAGLSHFLSVCTQSVKDYEKIWRQFTNIKTKTTSNTNKGEHIHTHTHTQSLSLIKHIDHSVGQREATHRPHLKLKWWWILTKHHHCKRTEAHNTPYIIFFIANQTLAKTGRVQRGLVHNNEKYEWQPSKYKSRFSIIITK